MNHRYRGGRKWQQLSRPPVLSFVLSPHTPGDPKTSVTDGSHLKKSVICRTDLTVTQGVSPSGSHSLGFAFSACLNQSLICLSVLRSHTQGDAASRENPVFIAILLASILCSWLCQTLCQAFHMPSAESSQRPPKVGPIGITIPSLQMKKPRCSPMKTQAPSHTANKWQNQNLNSAQADIPDYNVEGHIWAKLLRYGPRR